ncbi:uncharacterized protein F5147DRAFT_658189 [Suillus discolor]|uniref:Uncharacterized protein n=1 Tax=Suillus discolor TaxID=1912936 RepID=A0A9P7EUS0_9AGAM|nr:uncharacterized protein F5147DRAFT_658189 [Suillus discolor]KAG2090393.1 hypothetical protein F5147DRAFT_658189 [Suillus discolor]
MSSNCDALDNDSCSSDFEDGIETISANANLFENHSKRHLNVLEMFKQPPRGQDGGLKDTGESHRKQKSSGDDNTPRNFGHDMSYRQATSLPVIELPPKKRRKIGRSFVLCEEELLEQVMQEVAGVHKAMSRIEAIFNR